MAVPVCLTGLFNFWEWQVRFYYSARKLILKPLTTRLYSRQPFKVSSAATLRIFFDGSHCLTFTAITCFRLITLCINCDWLSQLLQIAAWTLSIHQSSGIIQHFMDCSRLLKRNPAPSTLHSQWKTSYWTDHLASWTVTNLSITKHLSVDWVSSIYFHGRIEHVH